MYTEKVIEHFKNPKNIGEIENPDAKATEGSMACGDMISMYLSVDPETFRIKDIKFQSYGCAANIATCSIITELVMGKTLNEAKKIGFKELAKELGGLPPVKMHCAVLAVDALRSSIRNYEEKHGLAEEIELTESLVRTRLRHVMYPPLGINIVSAEILEDVRIKRGDVEIDLKLSEEDEFKENIKEEIKERIEHIPGVQSLEINLKSE
ncbi:MAG: iron-sulfur cluster assembly scaffold protein [Candidatus Methanofastidiosia archaeon]